jgi:quercetin dioxygenase-like cupin family protein
MKPYKMQPKDYLLTLLFLIVFVGSSIGQQKNEMSEDQHIFPKGSKGPAQFFTGTVWVYGLVENDPVFTTLAGNVLFEPAARSNWHSHPAGQILIVTSGVGYHQIKGQPKEIIRKGDVVQCPPDKEHWHGASENSSMSHIYLITNTEKGIVEWGDPVTDEEFTSKD